jgi:tryptophan-rich sensory protein
MLAMRRAHYILIPLFYFLVAFSGRLFTAEGVSSWYPTLAKPPYTPPGSLIGVVWTAIYILIALSFILFVNRARGERLFPLVSGLFIMNGLVNAAWSYIFFTMHNLALAVADAALILLTVLALVVLSWTHSKASSLLLLPYLAWTSFATFLSYRIFVLNLLGPP